MHDVIPYCFQWVIEVRVMQISMDHFDGGQLNMARLALNFKQGCFSQE